MWTTKGAEGSQNIHVCPHGGGGLGPVHVDYDSHIFTFDSMRNLQVIDKFYEL